MKKLILLTTIIALLTLVPLAYTGGETDERMQLVSETNDLNRKLNREEKHAAYDYAVRMCEGVKEATQSGSHDPLAVISSWAAASKAERYGRNIFMLHAKQWLPGDIEKFDGICQTFRTKREYYRPQAQLRCPVCGTSFVEVR